MKQKYYITPFNEKSVFVYHILQEEGYEIAGFMDSNPYLWGFRYDGISIFPRCYVYGVRVIICTDYEKINKEIKDDLLSIGYMQEEIEYYNQDINYIKNVVKVKIDNLLKIYPKFSEQHDNIIEKIRLYTRLNQLGITSFEKNYWNDLQKPEIINGKIILNQFETIVTNRCSLRCLKCAAGIQYFNEPEDLNIERIISDYKRMLELIDWVNRVVIMGGEPFLFTKLDQVIDALCEEDMTKEKVGAIKIITNGTIIPKESVLESIKKNNITVWISNYRDKSRNLGKIMEKFAEKQIKYVILNIPDWSDVIQLTNETAVQSPEILRMRRTNDCVTRCRTVYNGRFYLCSLLKTMDCLKIEPFNETNYVELYNAGARDEIRSMLDMNNPLPDACSFCSGCSEKKWNSGGVKLAEQTKIPLNYIKKRDK